MNKVKHKRRHYQKFVFKCGWLFRLNRECTVLLPVRLKGRSYMRHVLDRITVGKKTL